MRQLEKSENWLQIVVLKRYKIGCDHGMIVMFPNGLFII